MSQQSMTQPQDAFSELARLTLADHTLESVMEKIAALARSTVGGADEVSVTFVEAGRATSVAYTGQLAIDLDERQYADGRGPCLDCIAGAQAVHVRSMTDETRWADWTAEARARGAGSSLSMPVPLQREVSAALNVYSRREDGLSDDAIELVDTFAAYAGVALANMHLYEAQGRVAEQLQSAMQSRAVIEQAKGILMGARRCSAVEALDLLVELSQSSNRKLREVAQALVDEAAAQ